MSFIFWSLFQCFRSNFLFSDHLAKGLLTLASLGSKSDRVILVDHECSIPKMTHYSVEPRDRILVNGYGFLSFAKNMRKKNW